MIIIDHNFAHLFELCDRVNVMQGGRITIDQHHQGHLAGGADRADGHELQVADRSRRRFPEALGRGAPLHGRPARR